jgi:hypothetical protein
MTAQAIGNVVGGAGTLSSGSPPDPKCQKIWDEINRLINYERPPTPRGGRQQGYQGMAKRWEEIAENRGKHGPGKFMDEHLKRYKKDGQDKLNEQLEKWDKNGCDNKGPPLPPLAREYAEKMPVPNGPLKPTPVTTTPPSLSPEAIAKAAGVSVTTVVVILVISRIIRLFPPLLPLEASPI